MKTDKGEKIQGIEPHVCQSDGMVYTSYPPQLRCKICGKFEFIHKETIQPLKELYENR